MKRELLLLNSSQRQIAQGEKKEVRKEDKVVLSVGFFLEVLSACSPGRQEA